MDKYGLIGFPLGHSFSISYFNQKFQDEGIDAIYENYEIPTIDALYEVLGSNPNLRGLNVTIPYKEKVMPFLDNVSPEARAIGAVNVIRVTHEGNDIKLKGYNSDVIGFTKSIEPMLEKKWHKKALILGTGGASVRLSACIPRRKYVLTCLTRLWISIPFSTTSSITRTRRCS